MRIEVAFAEAERGRGDFDQFINAAGQSPTGACEHGTDFYSPRLPVALVRAAEWTRIVAMSEKNP